MIGSTRALQFVSLEEKLAVKFFSFAILPLLYNKLSEQHTVFQFLEPINYKISSFEV